MKPLQGADRSGLRSPGRPPADADALQALFHYVDFYAADVSRARAIVKARARDATISTAVLVGGVSVMGAATAATGIAWFGIITAGLSAAIGAVAAWDSLFRHRELWVQRSGLLAGVQAVQRNASYRSARGDDRLEIADEGISQLNALFEDDLKTWSALKVRQATEGGATS